MNKRRDRVISTPQRKKSAFTGFPFNNSDSEWSEELTQRLLPFEVTSVDTSYPESTESLERRKDFTQRLLSFETTTTTTEVIQLAKSLKDLISGWPQIPSSHSPNFGGGVLLWLLFPASMVSIIVVCFSCMFITDRTLMNALVAASVSTHLLLYSFAGTSELGLFEKEVAHRIHMLLLLVLLFAAAIRNSFLPSVTTNPPADCTTSTAVTRTVTTTETATVIANGPYPDGVLLPFSLVASLRAALDMPLPTMEVAPVMQAEEVDNVKGTENVKDVEDVKDTESLKDAEIVETAETVEEEEEAVEAAAPAGPRRPERLKAKRAA